MYVWRTLLTVFTDCGKSDIMVCYSVEIQGLHTTERAITEFTVYVCQCITILCLLVFYEIIVG